MKSFFHNILYSHSRQRREGRSRSQRETGSRAPGGREYFPGLRIRYQTEKRDRKQSTGRERILSRPEDQVTDREERQEAEDRQREDTFQA
jgi:hypothetical protein